MRRTRGRAKPPIGTPLLRGHSLASGLKFFWPGPGGPVSIRSVTGEVWTPGSGVTPAATPWGAGCTTASTVELASMTGHAGLFGAAATVLVLCQAGASADQGSLFGHNDQTFGQTTRMQVHCPFTGVVYWDFGNSTGPNRLTWTPPSNWFNGWHALGFVAGTRGSSIWSDGAKVASQGTAITRGTNPDTFYVGARRDTVGTLGAHKRPIAALWVYDRELLDSEMMVWSADPFGMFVPPAPWAWWYPAGTAGKTPWHLFGMAS